MKLDGTVLVTGGTGFLGRRLVPALRSDSARVLVLSRDAQRAQRVLGDVDVTSSLADVTAFAPRIVVNLAGAGIADRPWTAARRELLRASRIDYTRRLHDALSAEPPAVLVSASAVGFYGYGEDHGADHDGSSVDEDAASGTGFAAELCRDWEAEALRFSSLGTRVVLARLGVVLGAGGMLARLRLPFSLGLGGRLGSGRQPFPWIHVADACALLREACANSRYEGPVNLTAPEQVDNAAFTRAWATALSRPAVLPVPAPILGLLGAMAKELLLGGVAVQPRRALEHGYEFAYPELLPALRDVAARQ